MNQQFDDDAGGETACWAHLLCDICGRLQFEHDASTCDILSCNDPTENVKGLCQRRD